MDRIADVEGQLGQIDFEAGRDVVGAAVDLDLVAHHVEQTAALEALALLFADEADRHVDVDLGIGADPQEVDVQRVVGDRVELQIAGQDAVGLAADLEVDQGREEGAGVDLLTQLERVERDHLRGLLGAVDHGRNASFAAHGPGGPLSGPVLRLR